MNREVYIHPILLAIFPALSFWAGNRNYVFFSEAWRTIGVCAGLTGIIYLMLWLQARNKNKAALLASLLAVTLLYFGQARYSIQAIFPDFRQPVLFLGLWLGAFVVGVYLVIRVCKSCRAHNSYLNWVSVALVISPAWQAARAALDAPRPPAQAAEAPGSEPPLALVASPEWPDIYYIILDGYGRGDVLEDLYAFDNEPFLQALRKLGFYIAEQSHTNYVNTYSSLSASLSGSYLEAAGLDPASADRTPIHRFLNQAPHLLRLRQLGYRIVSLRDADSLLQLDIADEVISYENLTLNNFELGFQALTLAMFWSPALYEYTQWEIVRGQLQALENFPTESDVPRFVFAHVLSPHPPFVFASNGDFVATNLYMAGDGTDYGGTNAEYIAGYIGQLGYLNQRILMIVEHLLSDPDRPVVIILQGDHGPGAYLDWKTLERTCLRERLPILNAYYFPTEQARRRLYASISPVNSFRLVFDQLLGQPMPLLADRSYYSTSSRPFDFIEVTGDRNSCNGLN